MAARPIDANRLLQVLERNFGHTGGAAVMRQLIDIQPTLTPPNEPLTLEQLRQMDGDPVYIPEIECWALVKREQFTLLLTFSDGKQCPASEWYEQVGPVFSRPPEGEEDT